MDVVLCFIIFTDNRSSHKRCSLQKMFLKISQISQENSCIGDFFKKVTGLLETATQVFSCEICEEHLRMTASVMTL